MVLYEKIPQAFPYMVCPDGALMIVSRTATRRPAVLEPYKKLCEQHLILSFG